MLCVVEKFVCGKFDDDLRCEDAIFDGKHFKAVIDGSTSKSPTINIQKTPGRMIVDCVVDTLQCLPKESSMKEAFEFLNKAIQENQSLKELADTVRRFGDVPCASIALLSVARQEIWILGDIQVILDGEKRDFSKKVDIVTAEFRSLYNQALILAGSSEEELARNDLGRNIILPMLEKQFLFQNNVHGGEFSYGVLDGTASAIPFIKTIDLSQHKSIILASDGYPFLETTLELSEQRLRKLLFDDPLLIREFKATKGLLDGQISFDDRAYIKIERSSSLDKKRLEIETKAIQG